VRFLGIEKYLSDISNITIYTGITHSDTSNDTNKKVRLNLETPNFLYSVDYSKEAANFDLVLHLCPYTCNYLNQRYNTNKFQPIFFPIDDYTAHNNERTIPVFYTGHSKNNMSVFDVINKELVHRLGSEGLKELQKRISENNYNGYIEKLKVLNETKICIAHNILSTAHSMPNYNTYAKDPLCIKHLPWHTDGGATLPQLKSRFFEGALMGCVLLVYKDKYKIIERYFTEGEDFIYFTSPQDLRLKVDEILANYAHYIPMAKSAQAKVKERYTTKLFLKHIKDTLQSLS
jgi:hypothetical protein